MPAVANLAADPADNVVDLRNAASAAAAAETILPDALPTLIEGRIDALHDNRIYGWSWDRANPTHRLEVEIRVETAAGGSLLLGRCVADRPRDDLAGGGIGDGCHAFETEIALPPDIDGSRVVAVIRSPGSGATQTFTQPSAEERLLDQALAPHFQRIADRIEILRGDHRRLAAGQQGLGRLLRDLQEGIAADRKDSKALADGQSALAAEIRDEIREVTERIASLEVFLLRMDTTLRGFDTSLTAKGGQPGRPSITTLLAAAGGAFLATLAGVFLAR